MGPDSTPIAPTSGPPPVSFELFPPRTDAARSRSDAPSTASPRRRPGVHLGDVRGRRSSRDRSLTVLRYMLENTDVEPMAHLTCVGSTHAEANRLVREFLDAGHHELPRAARRPAGGADPEAGIGDLDSAAELVQLIHRVQEEREPFAQGASPASRGHARSASGRARARRGRGVPHGASALPRPGPGCRRPAREGGRRANLAITQLFWHADDYLGFVERARAGGVTIPILPGIMPVTTPARLARLTELTGVEPPASLAIDLEIEPDPEAQVELGIDFAARLADEVVDGGAPGLHLYTFNRHEAVLDVVDRLGLGTPTEPSTRGTRQTR